MGTRVTLELPDHVYRHMSRLAKSTDRGLSEIITDLMDMVLGLITFDLETSINSMSDEDVLVLTELELEQDKDVRLSDLLYEQQAANLNPAQRLELEALMYVYNVGLLRKSEALAEAVRRGLRQPLEP